MDDQVINPSHYTQGDIQCWDAAEVFLGTAGMISACRFNINKYNWRLGKKGSSLDDARKLLQYAKKLVEVIEKGEK